MILHLDIETYSEHDLSKVGLYEYHRHPSTKLLCACWIAEENGKEIDRGHWRIGEDRPQDLLTYIARCDFVYAHNAEFEREGINNLTDWTHLYPEDMYCTMANAACYNYPLSLAKLGTALNIERPKDLVGAKLMKTMCAPAKDGTPADHSDENLDRLVEYCYRDVEAEVDIGHILTPMSEMQLTAYHSTMKMNEAGIPIDLDVVNSAIATKDKVNTKYDAEIQKITGTIGLDLIMSWQKLIQGLGEKGITVKNVQEETLRNILDNNPPDDVRKILEMKLDIAATSLKKYDAMLNVAGLTGRCRGCHQFHGASTGRWAGRLIQPQNLPRPSGKLPHKDTRDEILGGNADVQMLKDALRGTIYAPEGKEFVCVDWANIEGRMLAWLAGETWKVQAFADGQDLYKVAYSKSFGVRIENVTKDQRAIGKVQELALGYGGKHGSIEAFAPGKFTREQQDNMINGWRESNPRIVKFWWDLERAFKKCVVGRNDFVQTVDRILMKWSHKIKGVFVMLPSNRCIAYPNAKLKDFTLKVGKKEYLMEGAIHYSTYKNGQWIEVNTYGPKLAENITQGACACLMMEALTRIPNVIMSVHDEIVCEVDEGSLDLKDLEEQFSEVPSWAEGLPVDSEGWVGKYYRK